MKCVNCGVENDRDAVFCVSCGKKLGESTQIVLEKKSNTQNRNYDINVSKRDEHHDKKVTGITGVMVAIVVILLVCAIYNERGAQKDTLTGIYFEYSREMEEFYSYGMSVEFFKDGSVIITDGDYVNHGNYSIENNLVYVESPGVKGLPLQMISEDELVYSEYPGQEQVFRKWK